MLIYSVLEDCRHFFARVVRDRDDAQETIKQLVFACLHAEKYDLALKLMLVSISFSFIVL